MISRNVESHFGNIPNQNMRRSKLKRPSSHKTTMNAGDIVPIYRDELLPGDTVKIKLSSLVRMTTPMDPVMDNAWMDVYFFAIPRRLVWSHWREFMGENTTKPWTQTTVYTIPKTTAPTGGWAKGSIAHYMGMRMNTDNIWIDSCYLRAYVLCYNEWFRNENLIEPAAMSEGDATTTGSNGTDYVIDPEKGGMCLKATRYADYFSRALPEPQKGVSVYVPIGDTAPIIPTTEAFESFTTGSNTGGGAAQFVTQYNGVTKESITATNGTGTASGTKWATDLSNALGASINDLRMAYSIQKLMEVDSRSGSRYIEIIRGHFHVTSPDARQQRPEYLGGARIPINMTQVINQSGQSGEPLGDTAGMSLTLDSRNMVSYSSTEHQIILGLAVIRTERSYQQGIDKILQRQTKYDFYWPELANIGEQAIKEKEIYAQGTAEDDEVFGYQEAWAEYRYSQNRITGELNSDYATPLDSWHYGDDYSAKPTLSDDWVREAKTNVDRTLAIQDQDQFIADFYFDQTWVRPMPIYSVPGLTGWH